MLGQGTNFKGPLFLSTILLLALGSFAETLLFLMLQSTFLAHLNFFRPNSIPHTHKNFSAFLSWTGRHFLLPLVSLLFAQHVHINYPCNMLNLPREYKNVCFHKSYQIHEDCMKMHETFSCDWQLLNRKFIQKYYIYILHTLQQI